jgi:cysteine synthase A
MPPEEAYMGVLQSTLDAIGQTPLVQLHRVVPAHAARVLVKLEYFNPTGSYKDRMARAMIDGAEARGELRPGMTVVEYTGGSTGSSLAFVCAVKGYPLHIVTSDAFALEKRRTIAAFGAELTIVPSEGGVITPDLIPRMMARAQEIVAAGNAYATDQFRNEDMLAGYAGIADEMLVAVDGPIDAFSGGLGTAGMVIGVARALRAHGNVTQVYGLEPASSPVISAGQKGSHHIEGIGVGFVPPLLREDDLAEVRTVDEDEAQTMARRLAREEGIFAGISSGLNVVGALALAEELGPGKTVVTVAVDSGLKYLSSDLFTA